ncbi:MAG: DUF4214 domain-containing protein [Candidatus Dojkabacteria bacterium]|nr:DUF4214 domain-containing protein [Candidatus Dojkabacteria bacterium]
MYPNNTTNYGYSSYTSNSSNNNNSTYTYTSQNSSTNYYNTSTTNTGTESREEMVKRLYRTILGRDPDPNGLNYFLTSTYLTESQIAKMMYESTEHAEILKRAKDVNAMIMKLDSAIRELTIAQNKVQQQESLLVKYKEFFNNQYGRDNIAYDPLSDNYSFQSNEVSSPDTSTNQQHVYINDPFAEEEKPQKGIKGIFQKLFGFD